MKVILSNQCISLTGMLERGLGYHLEHRKNGFFAKRNTKGFVPSDGHWRFIVLCAELTRNKLYVSDKEIAARSLFQKRAQLVKQLMTERRCKTRAEAWRIAKEQIK